jgi:tetratricopeptide (TPR) repeat protein
MALHDVIREQLFVQWLSPDNHDEFSAVSRRLADHFQPRVDDQGTARTAKENSFVFHAIGANVEEGFKQFRLLYRERRAQLRTSDCEVLVRLAGEYSPTLREDLRAWLAYDEAELASDAHDWPRALGLLDKFLKQFVQPTPRFFAFLRLASVLRQTNQFEAAEKACSEAVESAARSSDPVPMHLVHFELGLIHRDQGRVDEAIKSLETAIRLAKASGDPIEVVAASNSLGTMLSQISPVEAISILRTCLEWLNPERDKARVAQIYNNLALAHENRGE